MRLFNKNTFLIQPYQVGSKQRRSLAIVIPSEITKKHNIDTSTILVLRSDVERNQLNLTKINQEIMCAQEKNLIPVEKSSEGSNQQISKVVQ